ncbi:MAG TPA: pirin family protein [Chitinophagales bacterium]|nr:pirin family protein [Chitinophagales bacterium]
MKSILHKAATRGHASYGWLDTYYSFSFANYYNPERIHFGVLRVLNDDTIAGGGGFGMHPHDNMEIITIPLEGALEHKDSMGNKGVIHKNDVQVMSAGTGILHSEYNKNSDMPVSLFQIWVFPKMRNVKPRYEQRTFNPVERINKWQTIVTPEGESPIWIHQDAYFSLGRIDQGRTLDYAIKKASNGVYAFVVSGSVNIDRQTLQRRDGLGIWDTSGFSAKAETDAEVLLLEVPMRI